MLLLLLLALALLALPLLPPLRMLDLAHLSVSALVPLKSPGGRHITTRCSGYEDLVCYCVCWRCGFVGGAEVGVKLGVEDGLSGKAKKGCGLKGHCAELR